jgi:hypothetical protein
VRALGVGGGVDRGGKANRYGHRDATMILLTYRGRPKSAICAKPPANSSSRTQTVEPPLISISGRHFSNGTRLGAWRRNLPRCRVLGRSDAKLEA